MPADTTPTNQQPTLRDWLAMHAPAEDMWLIPPMTVHGDGTATTHSLQERRYMWADLMLKAREATL
jgi:hypothetical protein